MKLSPTTAEKLIKALQNLPPKTKVIIRIEAEDDDIVYLCAPQEIIVKLELDRIWE